jgi:hypothetical protein
MARRGCAVRRAPARQSRSSTWRFASAHVPALMAPNLHVFGQDPIVRYVPPTELYCFHVEAEGFSGLCRELSRRQLGCVWLLRPEAIPCQDRVNRSGFVSKLRQGMSKIFWRHFVI